MPRAMLRSRSTAIALLVLQIATLITHILDISVIAGVHLAVILANVQTAEN